jgi:hypothetical protein
MPEVKPNGHDSPPQPAPHQIDDPDLIEIIAQADKDMQAMNLRIEGMLMLYMRKHKIDGQYRIGDDRKSLVPLQQMPMQMAPAPPQQLPEAQPN